VVHITGQTERWHLRHHHSARKILSFFHGSHRPVKNNRVDT